MLASLRSLRHPLKKPWICADCDDRADQKIRIRITVMRKLFPAQNPKFFFPETNILRYLPFLIFVITDCSRLFPVRFVFLWLSPFLVYPTILWVAFYTTIILCTQTDFHRPAYSISSCKPWYLKKRKQRILCVSSRLIS